MAGAFGRELILTVLVSMLVREIVADDLQRLLKSLELLSFQTPQHKIF
jgi:hypothetical protein